MRLDTAENASVQQAFDLYEPAADEVPTDERLGRSSNLLIPERLHFVPKESIERSIAAATRSNGGAELFP
jgi:hypothetical protein